MYFDKNKSNNKLKLCDICEEDNSRHLLTSCAHSTHQKVQCILLAIFVRMHIIRTIIGLAYFEVVMLIQSQKQKYCTTMLYSSVKQALPGQLIWENVGFTSKKDADRKLSLLTASKFIIQASDYWASSLILALNTSTSSAHVCSRPCWVNLFLRALNT